MRFVYYKKYALTHTEYKFLEIGINISLPSYVEIAIGENHGNELMLSLEIEWTL